MNPGDDVNSPQLSDQLLDNLMPEGESSGVQEFSSTTIVEKPTPEKLPQKEPTQIVETQTPQHESKLSDIREELEHIAKGVDGIPEEQMKILAQELKDTFDPNFSTLGHGTARALADKILLEGLRVYGRGQPKLDETAVPLFDSSKSFDEQSDTAIQGILKWPHVIRGSGAVILIMIPKPPEGYIGGSAYFNSVFEPVAKTNNVAIEYRIKPKYLRGYVDTQKGTFISNPLFKPTVPESSYPGHNTPPYSKKPIVIPKESSESSPEVW